MTDNPDKLLTWEVGSDLYIFIYIYIYIYIYLYICKHKYIYIHEYTYMFVIIFTHMLYLYMNIDNPDKSLTWEVGSGFFSPAVEEAMIGKHVYD
jgi:hypothetical protein